MGNLLQVCVYDADPEPGRELEVALGELNFIRIAGRANSPEALAALLCHESTNLVFFHLDPDPESVVDVIADVASRYPDLALIAVSHETEPRCILASMRAGCDQFVCEPIDSSDLASAVSRAASKHLLSQPKSRCICVTGASGGAGATSIASNLALEIAHLTDRTCALVDLDLQFGNVALAFDCEPKYNLHDLAAAGAGLDRAVLDSALLALPCKVAILSRPPMIEQHTEVTGETIHRVMQLLSGTHEYIVVDVPRQYDSCSAAIFGLADLIFVVCQPLVPSIRNARRYYEMLLRVGVTDDRIKIILNREDRRNGRILTKDVEETIKAPVYACIPNDYQFVARSIDFGRPISSLDRNNPVRAAISRIARDMTAAPDGENVDGKNRRGFFKRLLSK